MHFIAFPYMSDWMDIPSTEKSLMSNENCSSYFPFLVSLTVFIYPLFIYLFKLITIVVT